MARKKDGMFWDNALLNNKTYQQYYNRLTELATVMFEWKNLPETVDPRYLELTLFAKGMAVFFKDDELGFLALPMTSGGLYNVYGIPTGRRAIASNGYNSPQLDDSNSVIVYNNYIHTNSMLDVEMFARRLYEQDRTIDVNIKAQKTPVLITCNDTQRLTMKNLYKEYDGNQPFIFGDKNLDLNSIKVLQTGAPYVADKIRNEKTATWNEALTYLGISNTNVEKRERLIMDEVMRSQGGTIASRYSRLAMRRQACEQINRLFGLEIECEYREDFRVYTDGDMDTGDTGSGENVPMVEGGGSDE